MKYRFVFWKDTINTLTSILVFIILSQPLNAQSIFGLHNLGIQNHPLHKLQIYSNSSCNTFCDEEFIGNTGSWSNGVTMSPEGDLYSIAGSTIFIIDTLTGMGQGYYGLPPFPEFP